MATIKLENLTKRFDGVAALDDINLEIHDQEFFILRCIAGLEHPEEGVIYFDDQRVNELTPPERDVAFVFQSHILYPHLTVYENMAFPLHPRRLPVEEIDSRVKDIAAMLHIEHLLERKPSQLSGGETQRVGLGRAMVRRPQLFLMDEPISNLDAKLRTEMRAEIKWRQRQLGTTTLYVTHDQIEAMSMADRVAVLDEGRIQQVGTPMEIYNRPANRFVAGFIGNPSMNLLPCQVTMSGDEVAVTLRGQHQIAITDPQIARSLIDAGGDGNFVFGVHPEDVLVSPELTQHASELPVYSFEPLGAETIVELILGKDDAGKAVILKACAEPTLNVQIGQPLQTTFVPERLHFFHPRTGKAILA